MFKKNQYKCNGSRESEPFYNDIKTRDRGCAIWKDKMTRRDRKSSNNISIERLKDDNVFWIVLEDRWSRCQQWQAVYSFYSIRGMRSRWPAFSSFWVCLNPAPFLLRSNCYALSQFPWKQYPKPQSLDFWPSLWRYSGTKLHLRTNNPLLIVCYNWCSTNLTLLMAKGIWRKIWSSSKTDFFYVF